MNEPLTPFAKADAGARPGAAAFLEDLIDACVMESYFREHKASRQLSGFHATVAPHLAACAPEASAAQQRDYLTHLHQTLNAPSHPIRNRLLRLTAESERLRLHRTGLARMGLLPYDPISKNFTLFLQSHHGISSPT